MSNLTHGSLFSGIGGFELGAKRKGIKTIWNCEINKDCREVLKKHFPETKQYTDITKLANPEYVKIISGGFPCQDISIAQIHKKHLDEKNKAKGIKGERSGLWKEMFRICGEVMPKYIIIENSPMLISRGLGTILADLSRIGYVCEWRCLFASQFGFPHKRKRIFIIAYPLEKRRININAVLGKLPEILQKQKSRPDYIPSDFKRYDCKTIGESLRAYNGIPEGLDKKRIGMCGNAVIPDITEFLFKCIVQHHEESGKAVYE